MSDTLEMIPLEDAEYATLKAYAISRHGLEIKHGSNANTLRAQILVVEPDCKVVPKGAPTPTSAKPIAVTDVDISDDDDWRPVFPSNIMHYANDPKVTLRVDKTTEKYRARDVQVQVGGDVWQIRRGEQVTVPYRVFEALQNAIEKQAVETDETNPHTGMPIMDWQDVHSYPHNVIKGPNEKHVAQWLKATCDGFQGAKKAAA